MPNAVSEMQFSDPDQAAAAIRSTNIEFALLAPSCAEWRVGAADLAQTSLWWGQLGAPSSATGTMRSDLSWFVMAGSDARNWTVNRQALGAREICYLPANSEYVASYPVPGSWYSFAFPCAWLANEAKVLLPEGFELGEQMASFDLHGNAAGVRHAFAVATSFATHHAPLLTEGDTCTALQRTLSVALLGALDADCDREGRDQRVLPRVLEYLHAHPHKAISQHELCGAVGTSTRALRRLFPEAFGTTPGRYLRLRRLHLARRGLRSGQFPSVTRAAVHYGFFDLGRFASSYCRLFGEMPSHTVAMNRAR